MRIDILPNTAASIPEMESPKPEGDPGQDGDSFFAVIDQMASFAGPWKQDVEAEPVRDVVKADDSTCDPTVAPILPFGFVNAEVQNYSMPDSFQSLAGLLQIPDPSGPVSSGATATAASALPPAGQAATGEVRSAGAMTSSSLPTDAAATIAEVATAATPMPQPATEETTSFGPPVDAQTSPNTALDSITLTPGQPSVIVPAEVDLSVVLPPPPVITMLGPSTHKQPALAAERPTLESVDHGKFEPLPSDPDTSQPMRTWQQSEQACIKPNDGDAPYDQSMILPSAPDASFSPEAGMPPAIAASIYLAEPSSETDRRDGYESMAALPQTDNAPSTGIGNEAARIFAPAAVTDADAATMADLFAPPAASSPANPDVRNPRTRAQAETDMAADANANPEIPHPTVHPSAVDPETLDVPALAEPVVTMTQTTVPADAIAENPAAGNSARAETIAFPTDADAAASDQKSTLAAHQAPADFVVQDSNTYARDSVTPPETIMPSDALVEPRSRSTTLIPIAASLGTEALAALPGIAEPLRYPASADFDIHGSQIPAADPAIPTETIQQADVVMRLDTGERESLAPENTMQAMAAASRVIPATNAADQESDSPQIQMGDPAPVEAPGQARDFSSSGAPAAKADDAGPAMPAPAAADSPTASVQARGDLSPAGSNSASPSDESAEQLAPISRMDAAPAGQGNCQPARALRMMSSPAAFDEGTPGFSPIPSVTANPEADSAPAAGVALSQDMTLAETAITAGSTLIRPVATDASSTQPALAEPVNTAPGQNTGGKRTAEGSPVRCNADVKRDPRRLDESLRQTTPVVMAPPPQDESGSTEENFESLGGLLNDDNLPFLPGKANNGAERTGAAPGKGKSAEPDVAAVDSAEFAWVDMQNAQRMLFQGQSARTSTPDAGVFAALRPVQHAVSTNSTSWIAATQAPQQAAVAELKALLALLAPKHDAPSQTTDFLAQLNERIQMQLRDHQNILTIQLKPSSLGRIEIKAQTSGSGVLATIVTESASVKNYLENNLHLLQQNFQDQGLKIDRISVTVQEGSWHQPPSSGHHESRPDSSQQGDSRFPASSGSRLAQASEELVLDAQTILALSPHSTFHAIA
jgi:hypothetical protein